MVFATLLLVFCSSVVVRSGSAEESNVAHHATHAASNGKQSTLAGKFLSFAERVGEELDRAHVVVRSHSTLEAPVPGTEGGPMHNSESALMNSKKEKPPDLRRTKTEGSIEVGRSKSRIDDGSYKSEWIENRPSSKREFTKLGEQVSDAAESRIGKPIFDKTEPVLSFEDMERMPGSTRPDVVRWTRHKCPLYRLPLVPPDLSSIREEDRVHVVLGFGNYPLFELNGILHPSQDVPAFMLNASCLYPRNQSVIDREKAKWVKVHEGTDGHTVPDSGVAEGASKWVDPRTGKPTSVHPANAGLDLHLVDQLVWSSMPQADVHRPGLMYDARIRESFKPRQDPLPVFSEGWVGLTFQPPSKHAFNGNEMWVKQTHEIFQEANGGKMKGFTEYNLVAVQCPFVGRVSDEWGGLTADENGNLITDSAGLTIEADVGKVPLVPGKKSTNPYRRYVDENGHDMQNPFGEKSEDCKGKEVKCSTENARLRFNAVKRHYVADLEELLITQKIDLVFALAPSAREAGHWCKPYVELVWRDWENHKKWNPTYAAMTRLSGVEVVDCPDEVKGIRWREQASCSKGPTNQNPMDDVPQAIVCKQVTFSYTRTTLASDSDGKGVGNAVYDYKTHTFHHFWFKEFHDFNAPFHCMNAMTMLGWMSNRGSSVVHCAGGRGRTGTLLALRKGLMLKALMPKEQSITDRHLVNILLNLRRRRANILEAPMQFGFLRQALETKEWVEATKEKKQNGTALHENPRPEQENGSPHWKRCGGGWIVPSGESKPHPLFPVDWTDDERYFYVMKGNCPEEQVHDGEHKPKVEGNEGPDALADKTASPALKDAKEQAQLQEHHGEKAALPAPPVKELSNEVPEAAPAEQEHKSGEQTSKKGADASKSQVSSPGKTSPAGKAEEGHEGSESKNSKTTSKESKTKAPAANEKKDGQHDKGQAHHAADDHGAAPSNAEKKAETGAMAERTGLSPVHPHPEHENTMFAGLDARRQ